MCVNDLQRDTVLVADVAGRVEAALTDQWGLKQYSLNEKIAALRHRKSVKKTVIAMLTYLREERNRVIHHPRRALDDRPKFERFTGEVLPLIEKSSSPEDLGQRLSQDIERLFADLSSDIGNPDDITGDIDSMISEITGGLFKSD